jgi:ketosteroid isomerase-like protein
MKTIIVLLAGLLAITPVSGADESAVEDEIRAAEASFNGAYASNDYETYFSYYAADASLYFYGERQLVADYYEEWSAMIEAGGGVERNDISDLLIQVLPGGNAAVATYFVDNRSRSVDGEITTAKAFETDVWQKTGGAWKIVSLHYTEL